MRKIPFKNNALIKPIAQVVSSQIILQGLGFLISILLVRFLTKENYALYTIYISIQGILLLMSDSGLTIGFKAIGGKVWNDDLRMGSLIKTASSLRWKVILLALVVCIIYSSFILTRQGFSPIQIIIFALVMVGIIIPEVQISFLSNALLLKKDVASVQIANILSQSIRLILIAILIFIFKDSLGVMLVLLAAVISVWISYVYLLKKSINFRSSKTKISNSYKKILVKYLKLNYHTTAYYAFQGQISIFLIGVFGSTSNLANLGALTRFGMLFIVLNALVSNVLGPVFSRANKKRTINMIFFNTMLALIFLSVFILIIVYFFTETFLWILGPQYNNLGFELLLVFVSSLLSFIAGTIFTLNSSKGWIKHTPLWEIPASILSFIIGLILFDVSTLQGVICLSITTTFTLILLYLANSISGLKTLKQ